MGGEWLFSFDQIGAAPTWKSLDELPITGYLASRGRVMSSHVYREV